VDPRVKPALLHGYFFIFPVHCFDVAIGFSC